MFNPFLRLDCVPPDGKLRVWNQAVRCALLSALLLGFGWAHADVYQEVNDKILSGQWGAAQTLIDQQLKKQAADPQMRLMQSQLQSAQGQTALAVETLKALVQEFPELPEPYNNLAVLYAAQQRLEEALAALTLAVRARPDYALALENVGDVHLALARQAYLQAQSLPSQEPFMGARLASKIQVTGQLLQPAKP